MRSDERTTRNGFGNENLATYLQDHLAGAQFAVGLLQNIRDRAEDPEEATFAGKILAAIEEDRAELEHMADHLGAGGRSVAKNVASWITEKLSRMKLRVRDEDGFSLFEAFEVLSLGILGKQKLWTVLRAVASPPLSAERLDELAERARRQHDEVEAYRIRYGWTLCGNPASASNQVAET